MVVDNTDGCAVLFGTREVEGEEVAADAAAPEEGATETVFELLSEAADVSSSSTDAEIPRIFSWLSGRSPHVDRDCCASVYRQSALFRLQFEHGTPPSHFRLFWRQRLHEVATLCLFRVLPGTWGTERLSLGR